MRKYTVASATMVLNKQGNRRTVVLEYAKKITVQNAEVSDTAHRERLAVETRELNNSPNTTEIACEAISSGNDPATMHVSNASIGMSGSAIVSVYMSCVRGNTIHSEPTVDTHPDMKTEPTIVLAHTRDDRYRAMNLFRFATA